MKQRSRQYEEKRLDFQRMQGILFSAGRLLVETAADQSGMDGILFALSMAFEFYLMCEV